LIAVRTGWPSNGFDGVAHDQSASAAAASQRREAGCRDGFALLQLRGCKVRAT
jgi:hypothetical protein